MKLPCTTAELEAQGISIRVLSFACELCGTIHTAGESRLPPLFEIQRYECAAIGETCNA